MSSLSIAKFSVQNGLDRSDPDILEKFRRSLMDASPVYQRAPLNRTVARPSPANHNTTNLVIHNGRNSSGWLSSPQHHQQMQQQMQMQQYSAAAPQDRTRIMNRQLEEGMKSEHLPSSSNNSNQQLPPQKWPLNETELDAMATLKGWTKSDMSHKDTPMTSYWRGDKNRFHERLNFWLKIGSVGSYVDHPQQGRTQLFRKEICAEGAKELFHNPSVHPGGGYQHRDRPVSRPPLQQQPHQMAIARGSRPAPAAGRGGSAVRPCKFGVSCTRQNCWFSHPANHRVAGSAVPFPVPRRQDAGGKAKGSARPCKFGAQCNRSNCRFSHLAHQ
mmetsp:Transcript_4506/g.4992  ORF Transcript_4506/g.4992 Transcript_4506/m.4992 type:complete len:329 (+) Transcript_4506:91-1077(+)|eukprot:CAMPEP_0194364366 /NCGR_PEP_ID=MMETSP0174-20130528/12293_1 /TAXON_ID=216777 /ORGANISM="Proboscia alata, Strain PI-D3" /LENGTH=328 /DNA_ID=CAMNT_0039138363 /DNA_START=77 /DNA_END=1063 /DNA_ORIENTATION=-